MKRMNNIFEKLISDENLMFALVEVNKTHRWLPRHKPNKTVAWVEQDMSARVVELRKIIVDGFIPTPVEKKRRWDRSACKYRDICEPALWPDQYVHHALIQVIEPVLMRGMDKYCCGSIRKRGIHYGMKAIEKWMETDVRGTKYCLEADIHHFYDSIKPIYVHNRMKELIKDRRVIDLIERITQNGIQIGVYTSQWFANTVLQPLDHLIREGGFGVTHYIRYMDNFTIFGGNKRKLRKLLKAMEDWLNKKELSLKSNWQIFPVASRMPSALGYRYGRGFTLLRKRNLLRIKRKLSMYYTKKRLNRHIQPRWAAGVISQIGQLTHCNHYNIFKKRIKKGVLKDLKNVIRINSRKERLLWSTFLEQTSLSEKKSYEPKVISIQT